MKTLSTAALPLLLLVAVAAVAARPAPAAPAGRAPGDKPAAADNKTKHYVCAPCGMPCDKTVYDKPGTCPVCGARLVDQKAAEAAIAGHTAGLEVAILIFNGVEIIDYAGPWEVFGTAGFEVTTVAETKDPVTTAMGMKVVPDHTFADAPKPDIVLVPGGDISGPAGSAATLKWIADQTAGDRHTLSVCNGAFLLAKAGLLDGLGATTTYHLLDKLQTDYPKIRVARDQRFVDNGKIVTAAGLSSGIDGALHVVAKALGEGTAQQVALGMEYDWRPREGFARGALAESLIPDLNLDDLGRWTIVSTEGGADRWALVARAVSDLSGREIADRIGAALAAQGKWTSAPPAPRGGPATASRWTFNDRQGRPWVGTLSIEPVPAESGQYTARLDIARAG